MVLLNDSDARDFSFSGAWGAAEEDREERGEREREQLQTTLAEEHERAFGEGETIFFPRLTRSIIEGRQVSTEEVESNFLGDRQPIATTIGEIGTPSGTINEVTPDWIPTGRQLLLGVIILVVIILAAQSFAEGAGKGVTS